MRTFTLTYQPKGEDYAYEVIQAETPEQAARFLRERFTSRIRIYHIAETIRVQELRGKPPDLSE